MDLQAAVGAPGVAGAPRRPDAACCYLLLIKRAFQARYRRGIRRVCVLLSHHPWSPGAPPVFFSVTTCVLFSHHVLLGDHPRRVVSWWTIPDLPAGEVARPDLGERGDELALVLVRPVLREQHPVRVRGHPVERPVDDADQAEVPREPFDPATDR